MISSIKMYCMKFISTSLLVICFFLFQASIFSQENENAPAFSDIYLFNEKTDTELPDAWEFNPAYPGESSIKEENEERFLLLETISEKHAGILLKKSLTRDAPVYRLVIIARGGGLIEFGFSLWTDKKWIMSKLSKRLPLHSDWNEYEVTLEIPESILSQDGNEEQFVQKLIPSIYVHRGYAEIKSLTIEGYYNP